MKDPDQFISLLNSYRSDIKAEVLAANLLEEGFSPFDLLVIFNSSFKRVFGKDISKIEKYPLNKAENILAITVARDGLYDLLPEGLFHTDSDTVHSSGKGMASDSKKATQIENETRKFFLPFENEFFYQRVQLELQERNMLQGLNENGMDEYFIDFWKIDRSLPKDLISRLSAMLPFAKEIVGNYEMTANCLGAILREKVTCSVHFAAMSVSENEIERATKGCSLGNASLGFDTITNSAVGESSKVLKFYVGPLENTCIDQYLANGEIARFIVCFSNYFIPMETDVEFEVAMGGQQQFFVDDNKPAIMGYTTVI